VTATTAHIAQTSVGEPIRPNDGVVPLLEEIEKGRLKVVGTGFYITRFGLVMTARHVFEDLCTDLDSTGRVARPCYVLHNGEDSFHLRPIRRYSLLDPQDIAVAQADNFMERVPQRPLINLMARLSTEPPVPGSPVVTYAYPENEILDFTQQDTTNTIVANYYDGRVIGHVDSGPYMPYPHFRTSIEIRSGASGGPVFCGGRIIGISCRGWDFAGGEQEDDPLSSIIPISAALTLRIEELMIPPNSWEFSQIPENARRTAHTLAQLAEYGHINLNQQ